jgi:hypothetical protein
MVMFHVQAKKVNVVDLVIEADNKVMAETIALHNLHFNDLLDWRFSNYDVTVFDDPVTISSEE